MRHFGKTVFASDAGPDERLFLKFGSLTRRFAPLSPGGRGTFFQVLAVLTLLVVPARAQNVVRFTATSANVSGAGEAIKINLTEWSSDSRRDEFVAAWTLTTPAAQGRGGRGGGARGGGARGTGGRGARGGDATPAAPAAADLPPDPDAPDPDSPAARFGRGVGGRGAAPANASTQTPEASLAAAIKKASTVGILWTSENVGYSIKYAYRLSQPDGSERIILATDRRVGAWSHLWTPTPPVTSTDYGFSIIELRLNSKGEGEGRGVITGKVAIDNEAKTIALDAYTTQPVILKAVKRQS